MSDTDIERVFEAWRCRQTAPARCKLTATRSATISGRLKEHSADELIALITYAWDAETAEAQYWRGNNRQGRMYLGLDNLLRKRTLSDRVENAMAWKDEAEPTELDLGGMAAFRGQVTPTPTPTRSRGRTAGRRRE